MLKRSLTLLPVMLLCVGCSSTVLPSIGSVRFEDGQAVQSGSIELRAVTSGERFASRIDEQGGFILKDDEGNVGVPPGEYEVVVVQIVLTEDLPLEQHDHGRTVPRRYADYYTSNLRTTISDEQTSPIEIVLDVE